MRILHGMLDDVVPYEHGIKLSQLIASSDIDVTLRKSGDHRLCHDKDLELIGETMDKLVHKISNQRPSNRDDSLTSYRCEENTFY